MSTIFLTPHSVVIFLNIVSSFFDSYEDVRERLAYRGSAGVIKEVEDYGHARTFSVEWTQGGCDTVTSRAIQINGVLSASTPSRKRKGRDDEESRSSSDRSGSSDSSSSSESPSEDSEPEEEGVTRRSERAR